jgi:hypothetical protein
MLTPPRVRVAHDVEGATIDLSEFFVAKRWTEGRVAR